MTKTKLSAEQELHAKIGEVMRASKRTYTEAMGVVLTLDADLKSRWIRETLNKPGRK
jgi:hypothetical protein